MRGAHLGTEGSVTATVRRAVGIVTLNRPAHRNAINPALLREVREHLARFDADPAVGAVVLTGAGESFCAGMDLYALGEWGDETVVVWDQGQQYSNPWPPLSKPLICAANGPAATGGLELALACDVIIASDRARFADTHARAGFIPGWGLTVRLPLAVGVRRAREMSLTARYVDAEEALAIGLVERVVPHERLIDAAVELAETVAAHDPSVVGAYLGLYRGVEAELIGGAYHREGTAMQVFNALHRPSDTVAERAADIVDRGRRA